MDPTPKTPPAVNRTKGGAAKFIIAGLVLAALLAAIPGISSYRDYLRFRTTQKAVLGNLRALQAALDQHNLEFPERLFVRYEDIYAPNSYIRNVNPVRGEDYRTLFPFFVPDRRFAVTITLAGGRTVKDRSFGPDHPPSPPDGVHTETTAQGEKFEFTWRGGVRHGPMRAWRADGSLWCEAVFEEGRAISAIHVTRDGRRLDELKGEVPD